MRRLWRRNHEWVEVWAEGLQTICTITMSVRGVYRFSSLVKQNKQAKIYAVFCFAGKRKLLFYILRCDCEANFLKTAQYLLLVGGGGIGSFETLAYKLLRMCALTPDWRASSQVCAMSAGARCM